MNRRSFTKLVSLSVLSVLGLISLDGCVVRPAGTGPVARRQRRRVRRRVRRRMRRRMVGTTVVYVVPKGTVAGDEIEMDDGKIGIVNKVDGKNIEIETEGQIKSMTVEFE